LIYTPLPSLFLRLRDHFSAAHYRAETPPLLGLLEKMHLFCVNAKNNNGYYA
jgi:hypothetical protein